MDSRYELLGIQDPGVIAQADNFYNSLPETSWIAARGMQSTQTMNGGYPGQQGQMGAQPNPYAQAQQAYENDIVKGVSGFDITKPDYQQKVQDYFLNHQDPNAAQYPRVQAALSGSLATHKELKSYIQKNPAAAQTYANAVKGGMSPDDAVSQLREQTFRDQENQKQAISLAGVGEDPADYVDAQGNYDPIKVAQGIYRAKQASTFSKAPLDDKELGAFDAATQAVKDAATSPPATDKEYTAQKQAYIDSHPGADWKSADSALSQQRVQDARQSLINKIQTHHESNKAIPSLYWQAAGLQPPNYQFNGKGRGKMGGGPQAGLDQPSSGPSTYDATTGQWVPDSAPQTPVIPVPQPSAGVIPITGDNIVSQLPTSPADLTKPALYEPQVQRTGFQGLQQRTTEDLNNQQMAEAAKAAAEKQQAQALESQNSPLWEAKKQELLAKFKPEWAKLGPEAYPAIAKLLGKNPDEAALTDASGKSFAWRHVVQELMNDPRMQQIKNGAPAVSQVKVIRKI